MICIITCPIRSDDNVVTIRNHSRTIVNVDIYPVTTSEYN